VSADAPGQQREEDEGEDGEGDSASDGLLNLGVGVAGEVAEQDEAGAPDDTPAALKARNRW
jgi:hypothetical protein